MLLNEILVEDATQDALRRVRLALSRQNSNAGNEGGQPQFDMQGLADAADEAVAARNRGELLRVLIDGPDATIIRALQAQNIPQERHSLYIERYRRGIQRRLVSYVDRRYIQTSQVSGVRPPVGSWETRAQEDMAAFADAVLRAVGQ